MVWISATKSTIQTMEFSSGRLLSPEANFRFIFPPPHPGCNKILWTKNFCFVSDSAFQPWHHRPISHGAFEVLYFPFVHPPPFILVGDILQHTYFTSQNPLIIRIFSIKVSGSTLLCPPPPPLSEHKRINLSWPQGARAVLLHTNVLYNNK